MSIPGSQRISESRDSAARSALRFPRAAARKRRRLLSIAGLLAACLLLPVGILQLSIYRRNLIVAGEKLPSAPTFGAHERLFFLIPHCDDETLGAGGMISAARRRGLAVKVVFLTNGDASLSMQISEDARHLRRTSFRQMATMRQQEAVAALKELGVPREDIVFLGYPDGGTARLWQTNWAPDDLFKSPFTATDHSPYDNSYTPRAPYCGAQVLRDVTALMAAFKPTRVFSTHPSDTHPDHWAAYNFACAALESLHLGGPSHAWASKTQMLTFLVHRGVWPAPHGYHPAVNLAPPAELMNVGTHWMQVDLDDVSRKAKAAALARYASQQATMPQFLNSFLRRNELLGTVPSETVWVGQGGKERAFTLVQDATRDSMVHDLWEAADIRAITAQPNADTMVFQIKLAHRASRKLVYRLSLHVVTSGSARAWTADTRYDGSRFTTAAREVSAHPAAIGAGSLAKWTARRIPSGVEISVPRVALGLSTPSTLMVSATSRLGERTLDQTETGALHFVGTPPVPLK